MAKTLVTGATGFTGGALARRLVQRGEQVVAFVRSRDNAATLVGGSVTRAVGGVGGAA